MSKNKKGGSGNKPLQSTPVLSYGYKYGTDPMSNAHGFLAHTNNTQNKMIAHHRGGGGPISPAPVDGTAGTPIVVPQFNEVLPASPDNSNSASKNNNALKFANIKNSKYDHYAFTGGKSRKRKSRKGKSRKRKSLKGKRKIRR